MSNGARAIVKGLRAISDFEYEFEMNQLNRKLAPDIESVYVMASPEYSFLSSTGVKELATFGGDVTRSRPADGRRAARRAHPARLTDDSQAADDGCRHALSREAVTIPFSLEMGRSLHPTTNQRATRGISPSTPNLSPHSWTF